MTATTTKGTGAAWKWLLPVLAAVVLTIVVLPSGPSDRRYDLDSAQPDGYRGLRLLLEAGGTTVDAVDASDIDGVSVGDYDVVYVPDADAAEVELVARWGEFASGGGRLVLGSPSDDLGPPPVGPDEPVDLDPTFGGGGVSADPGVCTIDELADAGSLDTPFFLTGVDLGFADEGCYGDGVVGLVGRRYDGAGEVFTLAGADLFTNDLMGAPEPEQPVGAIPGNAVVAERLLGHGADPDATSPTRLAVVSSGIDAAGTTGEKTLTDFMSPGVKLGLLELGVAVGYYAWSRGRRHGRIVVEPAPVTIAGSAFVEAVGSLLGRQGDVARAAEVLRTGQCRELARRLGRPRTISRAELAAVIAERTGRDATAVARLLDGPVESEADLVTLTRELDSLRQEALHV